MEPSNDDIPADEMMLAMAIAKFHTDIELGSPYQRLARASVEAVTYGPGTDWSAAYNGVVSILSPRVGLGRRDEGNPTAYTVGAALAMAVAK
jgi:hypothetical protein